MQSFEHLFSDHVRRSFGRGDVREALSGARYSCPWRILRLQAPLYSSRNALEGSSPAARRAGTHDAIAAIMTNRPAIDTKVSESVGWTPTNIVAIARVRPIAAMSPITIPAPLSPRP